MEHEPFSVVMSIYKGEQAAYFQAALESIRCQSCFPDEIILVLDGSLTPELEQVIARFERRCPGVLKTLPLPEARGLGSALSRGVLRCSHELIARMDTDDISVPERFEKQLALFRARPALDICGGQIAEFDGSPENITGRRIVPLNAEDIRRYQRRRDAFNHVTVMFRKSAVLAAGNYRDLPLMEDTDLWCRMLQNGANAANLDETLVYVRAGEAQIRRRGGLAYFKKYRHARRVVLATGFIRPWDYIVTVAVQFFVCVMPAGLRSFVFRRFLRRAD